MGGPAWELKIDAKRLQYNKNNNLEDDIERRSAKKKQIGQCDGQTNKFKMHVFTIIRVLRGSEGGVFTIIRVLRGLEGGRFTIIRVSRGLDGCRFTIMRVLQGLDGGRR